MEDAVRMIKTEGPQISEKKTVVVRLKESPFIRRGLNQID